MALWSKFWREQWLSTFLEGKRKWLRVTRGEANHSEHMLENTVWIYFGEKREYGEKQSGFDYSVDKKVSLNTSVEKKGYEQWRRTNDLDTS